MEKDPLVRSLKLAAPALASADFVPILTHVCFDDSELFAYDGRNAIIVHHETGLKGAVRGGVLLSILNTMPQEIEFEAGKEKIVVKSGRHKAELPILPRDQFAFSGPPDDFEGTAEFSMTEGFVDGLTLAAAWCNIDTSRPEVSGVTLKADRNLWLYSTDNATMTRVCTDAKGSGRQGPQIILSKATADILVKLWKDLEAPDNVVTFTDTVLCASFDADPAVTLVAQLIPASPANYEGVLAAQQKGARYVSTPTGLGALLERVMTVTAKDPVPEMLVTTDGDKMTVKAKGSYGEVEGTLKLKADVGKTEYVICYPDRLYRMLEHTSQIGFGGPAINMKAEKIDYAVAQKGSKAEK
jgi:DNA polymerase III sliding clamp (beta) subunit (PCNA family)